MKRLAIILTALAICYAPAAAQFVPSIPGVTVYATATATTTDILVDLTVSDKLFAKPNSAQVFAQAAKSLAAITAAAGPTATVRDGGAKGASMPGVPAMTLKENSGMPPPTLCRFPRCSRWTISIREPCLNSQLNLAPCFG